MANLSPEENNKVAVEFFDRAWNKGDFSAVDELIHPQADDHSTVGGAAHTEKGIESFRQIVGMFRSAMPDIKLTILDEIYAGDKVVHRWVLNGTHTATPIMGVPAQNKPIAMSGTTTVRMQDGKIAERWANVDELGLLQQLGVVPSGPPPGEG
jgi:steroid delta-isomerase-like uncharacterized protein